MVVLMKYNNLAISWDTYKGDDQLISNNYSLINYQKKSHLPLILMKDLQEKVDLLHLLRTPHHVPENPQELVRFIEKIKGVLHES